MVAGEQYTIVTMLLEAINSVSLTYLATEYLLLKNHDDITLRSVFCSTQHSSRHLQFTFLTVLSINLLVHFHATGVALAEWIKNTVGRTQHFHIPRILVAICSFLLALYWDCRQKYNIQYSTYQNNYPSEVASSHPWSNQYFLQQLLQSFCRLLPIYPFLAVIISFGFLFIITAFEKLHLPLHLLNMPIYYGTLYGPLTMMYWDVKKTVVRRSGSILPR